MVSLLTYISVHFMYIISGIIDKNYNKAENQTRTLRILGPSLICLIRNYSQDNLCRCKLKCGSNLIYKTFHFGKSVTVCVLRLLEKILKTIISHKKQNHLGQKLRGSKSGKSDACTKFYFSLFCVTLVIVDNSSTLHMYTGIYRITYTY